MYYNEFGNKIYSIGSCPEEGSNRSSKRWHLIKPVILIRITAFPPKNSVKISREIPS